MVKSYLSPISNIPAEPPDADTISIDPVNSLCSNEPETSLILLLLSTLGLIITPVVALALAGI